MYVNKAIIIGNVGADPKLITKDDFKVVVFSVATSELWTDKNTGEKREKTEWHKISVYNTSSDYVLKYVKKGQKVYIEGPLQTRTWKNPVDGNNEYSVEIIVGKSMKSDIKILDRNDKKNERQGGSESGGGDSEYFSSGSDKLPNDEVPF
jgi:single-strand DNA-binding protein